MKVRDIILLGVSIANWIPFVPGEKYYPIEDKNSPEPVKLPKKIRIGDAEFFDLIEDLTENIMNLGTYGIKSTI